MFHHDFLTFLLQVKTGKETLDDTDVSKIADMALTKVMQMVNEKMAEAFGGKKGAPQASRHTGSKQDIY